MLPLTRSPCELYIKFLLAKRADNSTIRKMLDEKGLFYLTDDYVDRLREKCKPPVPFFPRSRLHQTSREFLDRLGVTTLFQPDEYTREALAILDSPRAKEAVEAMALTPAPPKVLASVISAKCDVKVSEEGVKRFLAYFWNVKLVGVTGTRVMMNLAAERCLMSDDPNIVAMAGPMKRAMFNDPRIVAQEMPSGPLALLGALSALNWWVPDHDPNPILQSMLFHMGQATIREITRRGAAGSKNILEMVQSIKTVKDILRDSVRPDEKMLEHLSNFALSQGNGGVLTLDQLDGEVMRPEVMKDGKGSAAQNAVDYMQYEQGDEEDGK